MIKELKHQPKYKIVIAALLLIGLVFLIFKNPRDNEYFQEVEKEITIARQVCENSLEWVKSHSEQLKMDKNALTNVPVNGKKVTFEHIKYPKILFLHTGFKHVGANNELYCTFTDPRNTSMKYYFNYDTESWVNKTRTRR